MPAKKHQEERSQTVLTPLGVASFPSLFETEIDTRSGNDTGKYVATLVFKSGADLSKLEAAVNEVREKAFPGVDVSDLKMPFKDNSLKEHLGAPFDKPGVNIQFKSQFKPGVFDAAKNEIIDQNEIYAGISGRAMVHAYSWDYPGGDEGISFRFSGFQKWADGDRLDGGGSFPAIEESDVADLL
jgi:hypothetical protein